MSGIPWKKLPRKSEYKEKEIPPLRKQMTITEFNNIYQIEVHTKGHQKAGLGVYEDELDTYDLDYRTTSKVTEVTEYQVLDSHYQVVLRVDARDDQDFLQSLIKTFNIKGF